MSELPIVVWIVVFVGVLGIPLATGMVLRRGAQEAGLPRTTALAVPVAAVAIWTAWIAVNVVVAAGDSYAQSAETLRPWFGIALLGAFAAALAATRIPVVARILAAPGTAGRLVWPQTFRVLGAVFLLVMLLGELPAVFALPAGLGDVAIGLAAPFVARRGGRSVRFHVLGLLDLVVAVSTGFLAGLGPARLLEVTPSTSAITLLPLALIPVTAVPLAAALHVTALARLRRTRVETGPVRSTHG